ncbi:hypothetical protein GQ54DRAFT_302906 [Martensiomyces pterosporus]|nr:hypothetical protein GQ54DRAFT_302906 [Martensiomyces pterosporus]
MSEEGEADFDAGQIAENSLSSRFGALTSAIREGEIGDGNSARQDGVSGASHPAQQDTVGSSVGAAREDDGDTRSAYSGGRRGGEYESRHDEARGGGVYSRSPGWSRGADEEYYYRRGGGRSRSRSTSRTRSRSREYSRRTSSYGYHDGMPPRRGDALYRGDEGDYRSKADMESASIQGLVGIIAAYGAREEVGEEEIARRDIDKERAIEELRSRVRAVSDRPINPDVPVAEGSLPAKQASAAPKVASPDPGAKVGEDRTASAKLSSAVGDKASTSARPDTADTRAADSAALGTASVAATTTEPSPAAATAAAAAEPGQAPDADDIEEGEHVEGEVDLDKPIDADYSRGLSDAQIRSRSRSDSSYGRGGVSSYPARSHSRGHGSREGGRSRSRSRSRIGEYQRLESHGSGGRRSGEYRSYSGGGGGSSGAYRRRYDDYPDRRDYRPREPYGGRSAYHSRYNEGYSSRYASTQSPDAREGGHRSERHYYSRYDRYDSGEMRSPTESRHYDGNASPTRQRSRTPRDAERSARFDHGDSRYAHSARPLSRGASRSRSPTAYSREPRASNGSYESAAGDSRRHMYGDSMGIAPAGAGSRSPVSGRLYASPSAQPHRPDDLGSADSTNPPPPPPPMPHAHSTHGQPSRGAERPGSPSYYQTHDTPYRTYSSRSLRRQSGTPKGGSHSMSSSHTPYGSRYEYEAHSRNSSMGGHYHGTQGYQQSRVQSPGANPHYGGNGSGLHGDRGSGSGSSGAPQDQVLPAFENGTDFCISKFPESEEWLKARERAREQARRVKDLSASARKTGFELAYANWSVQRADAQVQLAAWQIERAEQGLESSGRSLIDTAINEI